MIFLKDNLPKLNTNRKGIVKVHSDSIKIGHFKTKHKKQKLLSHIKMQAKARATIQAEYKYNANALIGVSYYVKNNGKMYRAFLSGDAIETSILENRNTLVDKHLYSLGLTGYYTAPITQNVNNKILDVFQKYYPKLYNTVILRSNAQLHTKKYLANIMANGKVFQQKHLYVYHHPTIAKAVAEDIYGLGIIGRLLHIYGGISKISLSKNLLTYVLGGQAYHYGRKFNENAKAVTNEYIQHVAQILTFHQLPTATKPQKKLMFGLLLVNVKYLSINNYAITIVNTALRRIVIEHPTVKNVMINNSTVVGNYNFRYIKKYPTIYHDTFRISNNSSVKRNFNRELINEITQTCLSHNTENYADVIGKTSVIYSKYVGWNVSIIELSDKNATSVILLDRPNIKPKAVSHVDTSPKSMIANMNKQNHHVSHSKPTNKSEKYHKHIPTQKINQASNNKSMVYPNQNNNQKKPHITIYTPNPMKRRF